MEARETLVTGGTGTLGRRVVERLRAKGHETRVMSRSGRPGTVGGDLLTGEGIEEAVRGVNTVIHCASHTTINNAPSPRKTHRADVEGTRLLLQAAAAAGVRHVVFVSIVGVGERTATVLALDASDGRIQAVHIVVNPDKLGAVPPSR